MKLCEQINIDGYIFSTNITDYWIDVDGNHGQKFTYQEAREAYSFDCIGIDTQNMLEKKSIWFKFQLRLNLEETHFIFYKKQYLCEDLTYSLQKGKSIEF